MTSPEPHAAALIGRATNGSRVENDLKTGGFSRFDWLTTRSIGLHSP